MTISVAGGRWLDQLRGIYFLKNFKISFSFECATHDPFLTAKCFATRSGPVQQIGKLNSFRVGEKKITFSSFFFKKGCVYLKKGLAIKSGRVIGAVLYKHGVYSNPFFFLSCYVAVVAQWSMRSVAVRLGGAGKLKHRTLIPIFLQLETLFLSRWLLTDCVTPSVVKKKNLFKIEGGLTGGGKLLSTPKG